MSHLHDQSAMLTFEPHLSPHLPVFREQCEARGANYPDDIHYIAHLEEGRRTGAHFA